MEDKIKPFFCKKGKKAVLLLHGLNGTPYELKELGDYLAEKGITVYAPMLAGHGVSAEALIKTDWKDWYKSAEKALEKLDSHDVYVGGLCNGGLLSLLLASKRRIKGVIPMGCSILPGCKFLQYIPTAKLLRFISMFCRRTPSPGCLLAKNKKAAKDMPHIDNMPFASLAETFDLRDVVEQSLPKIECPALILHATKDNRADPKGAKLIYRNISSKTKKLVYLKNSYHIITKDFDKERVFKEVHDFVLQK